MYKPQASRIISLKDIEDNEEILVWRLGEIREMQLFPLGGGADATHVTINKF